MKKIFAPVGISGSGKSTLFLKYFKNCFRVCPDDLRKALTGNISNQAKNHEVFAAAYYALEVLLQPGAEELSVYFDATNLDARAVDAIRDIAVRTGAEITFIIMKDSEDLKTCESRVRGDLVAGIDRANTLIQDDILARQQGKYYAILPYIKSLEKRFSGITIKEYRSGELL